ncbi:MAG: hypothetical protein JXB13_16710 [Phycisphaerae bacterium]|nr:hypothetical protein [Phycisphaerae bacterium]
MAAVLYLAAPILQSPEAKVEAEADRAVEQARRLIWQYSAEEERLAVLLDTLSTQAGLDVSLPADKVAAAIEAAQSGEAVDPFGAEEERLKALLSSGDRARADLEQRYLRQIHGENWQEHATRVSNNVPRDTGQIAKAREARDALLARNQKVLDEALTAVDAALAASRGDVDASRHVVANRMKAAILYQKALVTHRRAQLQRSDADALAVDLADLAGRAKAAEAQTRLVADSGVDARIAATAESVEDLTRRQGELQETVSQLRGTLTDLQAQLADAQQTADAARAAMESLEDAGVDLTDPQGYETFVTAYRAQAEAYRNAIRKTQELQFGTLANARLDESGDFLKGGYRPASGGEIQPQPGIAAIQRELEQREAELAVVAAQIQRDKDSIAAFELTKGHLAEQENQAQQAIAQIRTTAADVFAKLTERAEAVRAVQDDALATLAKVRATLRTAEQAADERTRVETGDISAEKLERMPESKMQDDRWWPGNLRVQTADVLVRESLVRLDQYRNASVDIALIEQAGPALQLDAATTDLMALRDDARTAGVEAAQEAAGLIEKAAGQLQNHWTLAAQVASAQYLLALYGDRNAIEAAKGNYEAVIDVIRDRDPDLADAYQARIEAIEQQ